MFYSALMGHATQQLNINKTTQQPCLGYIFYIPFLKSFIRKLLRLFMNVIHTECTLLEIFNVSNLYLRNKTTNNLDLKNQLKIRERLYFEKIYLRTGINQ